MRLLLTSAGITNDSIRKALVELLGKPVAESNAICVPTAIYALPGGTAMPGRSYESWARWPGSGSALIIVGGGNCGCLSYWMQASGLAERLPELLEARVYLGVSAGSLLVTHGLNVDRQRLQETGVYYDDQYEEAAPPNAGSDQTLQLVDFVLRPHLNAPYYPGATLELMERAAGKVDVPLYAIDDQTAIKVVGGAVTVVSEGEWNLFEK